MSFTSYWRKESPIVRLMMTFVTEYSESCKLPSNDVERLLEEFDKSSLFTKAYTRAVSEGVLLRFEDTAKPLVNAKSVLEGRPDNAIITNCQNMETAFRHSPAQLRQLTNRVPTEKEIFAFIMATYRFGPQITDDKKETWFKLAIQNLKADFQAPSTEQLIVMMSDNIVENEL